MSSFAYTALTPQGKTRRGKITAQNAAEANLLIKQQGIFPTQVQPTTSTPPLLTQKLSLRRLALLTRQMATLTGSGVSLTQSLRILLEEEKHSLTLRILHSISDSLQQGQSFSEALSHHSDTFNPLYLGIVKTGEKSGSVPLMLAHLADFLEQSATLRRKIISSLFYPAIVLCLTGAVFILLFTFILPRFQSVFTHILGNRPLPPMTQALFTIGNFLHHYAFYLFPIPCAILPALLFLSKSKRFSNFWSALEIKIPLWNTFYKKWISTRFCRTLGVLLSSGISLIPALKIIEETSSNRTIALAVRQISSRVREGDALSTAMRASGIFSPMASGMIQVGEEIGKLGELSQKIASSHDEDIQSSASFFTTVLEPALILLLALVVITVIVALFTPLITLITELSSAY